MIPVVNAKGEKMGTAVEWTSLTPQTTFNNEMQKAVDATSNGDRSIKGDASLLDELYTPTMQSTNKLVDIINTPIQEIKKVLVGVASGNLLDSADTSFQGEFGQLSESLNQTINSLNGLLGEVVGSSSQISQGSKELAASSQTVSQGATKSSASLEQITASMSEINSQKK
jgi:methyl-accepting chemotaxis protein